MIRSTILTLLAVAVLPAAAQDRRDPVTATYKVEFRIRDGSDAAAKNGRRYTMWIDNQGKGTFHVGERIPVATGSFQPGASGAGVNPLVNTQFNYQDVGVSIDTNVSDQDGKVNLSSTIDVSIVVPTKPEGNWTPPPTIAQIRIGVKALVSLNKPSLVASVDDPVTGRKFDVEAVVTKVE
jgi:hypothetical protein